jgi:membrane protease YdiL (CAAX protease family)
MSLPSDSSQITIADRQIELAVGSITIEKRSIKERLFAYVKQEISDVRRFIAKPVRRFSSRSTSGEKWARIALFFSLGLLIDTVYVLSIGSALDSWTTLENTLDMTGFFEIFLVIAGAPLIEELIFRAGLRNLTYSLFFGPVLICLMFGTWQISLGLCLFGLCVAMLMEYSISAKNKLFNGGKKLIFGRQFIQHYPKVYWLYACAFAIVHVQNFSFSDATGLFVIFAVIPQFVAGVLWGYVRLRDGLMSSMALHSLNNLFVVLLLTMSDN